MLISIPKLRDARDAGGEYAHLCSLILVEGDSASAMAMGGLSVVGRNRYGLFPLRGKLLNVSNASEEKILANTEIQNLKEILGLRDKKRYKSVRRLRYGRIILMADPDDDGLHFNTLFINIIHKCWPSLLKVKQFIFEFSTPLIKVKVRSRGLKEEFYSNHAYEKWIKDNNLDPTECSIKYYKGLGSSTRAETIKYFRHIDNHLKELIWGNEDGLAIELAFSPEKSNDRKIFISNFEPGMFPDPGLEGVSYKDYIHKALISYSLADLNRSIPSMVDGLKPSQRKILFCSFKRELFKKISVLELAGYVSEHSAYHHALESLSETIIRMAQNFWGSNNINLLKPIGQFGTRLMGGKDHARARYVSTKLCSVTRKLFRKSDHDLLEYLNADGKSVEPKWYIPIIPLVLINGSSGIATGWSSYIPNYNAKDVIANLKRMLRGKKIKPLVPGYRGFQGTIVEKDGSYVSHGKMKRKDQHTLHITELPILVWTETYIEHLKSITDGFPNAKSAVIEGFKEEGDDVIIDFEIKLRKKQKHTEKSLCKTLKLSRNITTRNMYLFNDNMVLQKYHSPEEILEDFYKIRLKYYERRKENMLAKLKLELMKLENKARYIEEVLTRKLELDIRLGWLDKMRQKLLARRYDPVEEKDDPHAGETWACFSYLLTLPCDKLDLKHVVRLDDEIGIKKKKIEELEKLRPKDMWMADLESLERCLKRKKIW